MGDDRYELTFSEDSASTDRVIVHRTGTTGPGGHPVYVDDTGLVRAEIRDRGDIRMLPSSTHQSLRPPKALRRVA
jgi:hypothetical protein